MAMISGVEPDLNQETGTHPTDMSSRGPSPWVMVLCLPGVLAGRKLVFIWDAGIISGGCSLTCYTVTLAPGFSSLNLILKYPLNRVFKHLM